MMNSIDSHGCSIGDSLNDEEDSEGANGVEIVETVKRVKANPLLVL